jgi:hypothetical protein
MQAEQQAQQRRAGIDAFLINSTANIYAGLVAKEWDGGEPVIPREVLLKMATLSKDAANALGESLGFLNPPPPIQIFETPKVADDVVVEIPETPTVAAETPTIELDVPTVIAETPVVTADSDVIASETPTITLESSTQ